MKALLCFFGICIGRPNPDKHAPGSMASYAPHVRGPLNASRVQSWWAIALIPVMVSAVFNIGQQYFAYFMHGGTVPNGWRENLIAVVANGANAADAGLGAFLFAGLVHIAPIFVVAYITGALWEGVFAHVRRRHRQPGLLVTALLFTALMPPAAPLWHVVLGMSFAVVFAQEAFGGHGKTFLPPALAGAAMLQVSFPSAMATHPVWAMMSGYNGTNAFSLFADGGYEALLWAGIDAFGALVGNAQSTIGTSGVLAAVIGGLILFYGRAANWRAPAGVIVGVIVAAWLTGWAPKGDALGWHWHLVLGGAAFSALFLATDPAGSSATNPGRWMQGILAGVMVVLIRVFNPGHPDGIVPAFLFAAVMAPLIDAAVVRWQVRRAKARAHHRRALL